MEDNNQIYYFEYFNIKQFIKAVAIGVVFFFIVIIIAVLLLFQIGLEESSTLPYIIGGIGIAISLVPLFLLKKRMKLKGVAEIREEYFSLHAFNKEQQIFYKDIKSYKDTNGSENPFLELALKNGNKITLLCNLKYCEAKGFVYFQKAVLTAINEFNESRGDEGELQKAIPFFASKKMLLYIWIALILLVAGFIALYYFEKYDRLIYVVFNIVLAIGYLSYIYNYRKKNSSK